MLFQVDLCTPGPSPKALWVSEEGEIRVQVMTAVARRGSRNSSSSSGRVARKNHRTAFKAVFTFFLCLFGNKKSEDGSTVGV